MRICSFKEFSWIVEVGSGTTHQAFAVYKNWIVPAEISVGMLHGN